MATETKYPLGVQEFESLRNEGYLYVDKTQLVLKLVEEGRYYFLSRPRRFGKSMLISTLKAYFEGKRPLFKGLYIDRDDVDWEPRPVLHLDLNAEKFVTEGSLDDILDRKLKLWEKLYGHTEGINTLAGRFEDVIARAHEQSGRTIAILVDEYDKPLLQAIGKPDLLEDYRATLKAFYGVMKSSDAHIKFALLTGVTKFSKVSVFSDLNNLKDISMIGRYQEICGITEQEIRDNLHHAVVDMATANNMAVDECYAELKRMYDGYRFTEDENAPGMYNPFSLLNALQDSRFRSYWFETGTPDFLLKVIKQCRYRLDNLTQDPVTPDLLGGLDALNTTPLPLLFQSGYLTLKSYDARFKEYTLGYPNAEVEEGFVQYLSRYYTQDNDVRHSQDSRFFVGHFIRDVESGRTEDFMQRLNTFLHDGDYQIAGKAELYFQNVMYIVFKMLGFYTQVERHTSNGRVDVVLQTPDYVYIFELKLDGTSREALQQIEDKQYAAPFLNDPRKVIKVGANFSSEHRYMEEWEIKE